MPQVYNLPDRIPESNYREAELLNRGLMENVLNTRERLIKRNQRAKTIKEAMRSNPNMFGPNGAQVDTFGGEDIDINRARYQDDSLNQGQSTIKNSSQLIDNSQGYMNTRNPNVLNSIKDITNAQSTQLGAPPNPNVSIPATLGMLGQNTPLMNSLQNSIVSQGLANQQQIMGQSNSGNVAPLTAPTGTGTVLAPQTQVVQPVAPTYPLSASVNSQTANKVGSSQSESFAMNAKDHGGSFENALVSTETTDKRTNMNDPIKKNLQDLDTLAILGSTNFNGAVSTDNNFALRDKNTKIDYLTELNKQRATEGVFEKQTVTPLKVEDKGSEAFLRKGFVNSSNVSNSTNALTNIKPPSNGSNKPDTTASFVRGSNGKIIQVEYDGDPADPNTKLKTDFKNGSISFLNGDFSGMNRDKDNNLTVAKSKGEAMRNSKKYLIPHMENTDYSFGGKDKNKIMKKINGNLVHIGWWVVKPVNGGYATSIKPLLGKWTVGDNSFFNVSGTADEVNRGSGFSGSSQMDNN